jgi:hypothetical protein
VNVDTASFVDGAEGYWAANGNGPSFVQRILGTQQRLWVR